MWGLSLGLTTLPELLRDHGGYSTAMVHKRAVRLSRSLAFALLHSRELTLCGQLFFPRSSQVGKWDVGHFAEAMWPTRRGFDKYVGLISRGPRPKGP